MRREHDGERNLDEEHILASDVWGVEKALTPMTAEEEVEAWRKTVIVFEHLSAMSDTLLIDPLILASVDALGRSREELARVEDRLTRPEGAQLGPREEERLRGLMRRSDALSAALDAVEREARAYPRYAEYVEILREAHEEASEQFRRYRSEVGILVPPAKNNA